MRPLLTSISRRTTWWVPKSFAANSSMRGPGWGYRDTIVMCETGAMGERDRHRALADGGGEALDRSMRYIARRVDARPAGFQEERIALEWPARGALASVGAALPGRAPARRSKVRPTRMAPGCVAGNCGSNSLPSTQAST